MCGTNPQKSTREQLFLQICERTFTALKTGALASAEGPVRTRRTRIARGDSNSQGQLGRPGLGGIRTRGDVLPAAPSTEHKKVLLGV